MSKGNIDLFHMAKEKVERWSYMLRHNDETFDHDTPFNARTFSTALTFVGAESVFGIRIKVVRR